MCPSELYLRCENADSDYMGFYCMILQCPYKTSDGFCCSHFEDKYYKKFNEVKENENN